MKLAPRHFVRLLLVGCSWSLLLSAARPLLLSAASVRCFCPLLLVAAPGRCFLSRLLVAASCRGSWSLLVSRLLVAAPGRCFLSRLLVAASCRGSWSLLVSLLLSAASLAASLAAASWSRHGRHGRHHSQRQDVAFFTPAISAVAHIRHDQAMPPEFRQPAVYRSLASVSLLGEVTGSGEHVAGFIVPAVEPATQGASAKRERPGGY